MATNHYTMPHSSGNHYLSLQEAVSLGYGAYQTLRTYIADGRLPAVRIGRRVKVLRSDLDKLPVPIPTEPVAARSGNTTSRVEIGGR